jgi:DNA-binding NarL/FixJ family response regulator
LLDPNLPDGHGTAILRHVCANHLPVKVAVFSGTAAAAVLREAADLRPDATFTKPPDWEALLG